MAESSAFASAAAAADSYEVAVVGGGVIGAAAALGLGRQGRRVLLLEPSPPRLQPGSLGHDLRTLALSPASRSLLERLGVWQAVAAAPYRRMEVWEERGTEALTFDAADVARAELGWIVENGPLAVALWGALEGCAGVTRCSAPVVSLHAGAQQVDLTLPDASAHAQLVVAADGAASAVRGLLGVAVRTWDVEQSALATVVRTERPHEDVAYQRFLLDGPLALLPTTEPRHCSVVWSQSPAQAQRRCALDPQEFAAELARAVQHRLGAVTAVDRRVTFPLRQQLAGTFNPHDRVVLLGDAARVVHPLAGLGANLGFEDVRDLLAGLDADCGDPGAAARWRAFDRVHRARARLMLDVLLGLRRVYARGDPVSQLVRNLGVRLVNRAAPVKRQIMMEAMGLGPVGAGLGARGRRP